MPGKPMNPREFWSSIATSRLSDLGLLSSLPNAWNEEVRRQALDDEIAAMSAALLGLKEQRNFFCRKPKFPPEVLEYIFAHVALEEIPGQDGTEGKEASGIQGGVKTIQRTMESKMLKMEARIYEILGWVKLTHVCRAWRAIALADGNRWLWSTMDTGHLSMAGMYEILDRSHPHPITSRITLSLFDPEVCGTFLEPQYLYRLKSLRIAPYDRVEHKHIKEDQGLMVCLVDIVGRLADASRSHPGGLMIETLAVEWDEADYYLFSMPYGLLAPQLRHLTLRHAYLSLDEDIVTYPQLTHLEITISLRKAIDNELDDFLEFLRGSPNLQVLHLVGSLPRMEHIQSIDEENVERPRVDLPHLQNLRLVGSLHGCALFAWCLNLPGSCSIAIDALPGRSSTELRYDLMDSMLRRWAQSPMRLKIFSHPAFSLPSIKVWHTAAQPHTDGYERPRILTDKDEPPRLHLSTMEFMEKLRPNFWDILPGSFSFENLVHLHVRAMMNDSWAQKPQWWRKAFGQARAVQGVWVGGNTAVISLVSALNSSVPVEKRRDEPLFPGLKTLSMEHFLPVDVMKNHALRSCLQARRDDGLSNVIDIVFSDEMLVPTDFEDSLAELEGLATYRIKRRYFNVCV